MNLHLYSIFFFFSTAACAEGQIFEGIMPLNSRKLFIVKIKLKYYVFNLWSKNIYLQWIFPIQSWRPIYLVCPNSMYRCKAHPARGPCMCHVAVVTCHVLCGVTCHAVSRSCAATAACADCDTAAELLRACHLQPGSWACDHQ